MSWLCGLPCGSSRNTSTVFSEDFSVVIYSTFYFQVMTRMNLLTVGLCLVMGRPYQFYYFVPLVSFWFVVVYITMAVFPHVTAASVRGTVQT